MHQPFCCLFNNNSTIICTNRETILKVDKTQCIDPEFVYIWWIGGSMSSHPTVQLCENDLLASRSLYYYVIYIASLLLQDQFYICAAARDYMNPKSLWASFLLSLSLSVYIRYLFQKQSSSTSRYHTYRLCFPCCSVYISSSTELRGSLDTTGQSAHHEI